ncbi:hypothetical protein IE5_05677 [Bacillus cereus BAG3X2-2]|uniref:hypothetical protein n=1 Tax=Bacillus cereus TaxID=1396 RepID=UPI0002792F32|nr:hypothetical protein [Bacillus cereus]EJQ14714.1 hypothetical protein IE5_05677 [Bacillus cereus BAG3X2-2]
MLKKLAIGSLATGIMLSGAGGVMAAENTPSAIKTEVTDLQALSTAYTTVNVYGSTVEFAVKGLENPFTSTFYDRIAWTNSYEEPNNYNTLAVAIPQSGNGYSAYGYESLNNVKQKIGSNGGTVYGFAKANDGKWYRAGQATIKF